MTTLSRATGLALRPSGVDRLRAVRDKLPPLIARPKVMQNINLFLWRHAEAEDTWPDLERPLTSRGQRDAARVAKALAKQLDANSRIVISPATRTRETAEPLVSRAALQLEIDARLAPGAAVGDVLDALESAIASCNGDAPALVLVGHQPWLGQVARHLLTGHDGDWSVKKAAAWWLVRRARDGNTEWTLRSVLDPDLV
jgi:phosphohistidine phosphatase